MAGASWVWVYDRLHSAIKVRHYSAKTLQAYKAWTQKFQTFTKSKDPERVTMDDVKGFLSFLAVDKKVAASSQVAPHLTVVTLSVPLVVVVSAWVDVLGAWVRPKGTEGP